MDSFFLVQSVYFFIATSNGETTSFCAYGMTNIIHHGAVRKVAWIFALSSAYNLRSCHNRHLKFALRLPLAVTNVLSAEMLSSPCALF